jgi:hypothetical protein
LGLLDVLLGRKRLKEARREDLFALTTAAVTLDVELGLRPAGSAGVCFKPLSAGDFVRVDDEATQLVDALAAEAGTRVRRKRDDFGFEWVVVEDRDLEDLVTAVHAVAQELAAQGFGSQLLAALFRFDGRDGSTVYFVYGYKRGAWWPFVPTGHEQDRDNAKELELKAKLEGELPVEQDLTRWFALFDAPV